MFLFLSFIFIVLKGTVSGGILYLLLQYYSSNKREFNLNKNINKGEI